MENSYANEDQVLLQKPKVEDEQQKFMQDLGFRAVARNDSWVLWEMSGWPEVAVWLQGFQTDLSVKYVIMQTFKAGLETGKVFQINEHRLNLGLPVMTRKDAERLSAFSGPWLGCYLNPRHES